MRAKVKMSADMYFHEVKIGDTDLQSILIEIHQKVQQVVMGISIENQSENPNYEDIDAPLHGVLNLIEKLNNRTYEATR